MVRRFTASVEPLRAAALFLFLAILAMGGCAAPPIPAYLSAARGCAVVVGSSVGSRFDNPTADGFWQEANRQIAGYLYDALVTEHYKVTRLTIAQEESRNIERLVAAALVRGECNRALQISHTVGEFQRAYRYPRTTESFDSFRTGTFAASVYADLKRSGALEALRRKVPDLGNVRDPQSFAALMRGKGNAVSLRPMEVPRGRVVEVLVAERGLSPLFVTSELCGNSVVR